MRAERTKQAVINGLNLSFDFAHWDWGGERPLGPKRCFCDVVIIRFYRIIFIILPKFNLHALGTVAIWNEFRAQTSASISCLWFNNIQRIRG
jgi:hypothetical protein